MMLAICGSAAMVSQAQNVGLKTNLIGDALLSPNIGVETQLAPKWSLDVSGQVNFWTVNQHKWKHWFAQPEARYWLCEAFNGHYFATHLHGGQYNLGNLPNGPHNFLGTDFGHLRDRRYQGWFAGAGIGYGYSWVLGRHWNIEAEIGFGWAYSRYDVYPCAECGRKLESDRAHNYVGPTKAALNIVYVF